MNRVINELNIKTFVLYYSVDDYTQMGEQGVNVDVLKNIDIFETCYNLKFKDLTKKKIGEDTIKIEITME